MRYYATTHLACQLQVLRDIRQLQTSSKCSRWEQRERYSGPKTQAGFSWPRSAACHMASAPPAGHPLGSATAEVALTPIKAVTVLSQILFLHCYLSLLNNLRWMFSSDSWSHIWFLCKTIPRGIALNASKTAFLKWSSTHKINFPKALNYQEKNDDHPYV